MFALVFIKKVYHSETATLKIEYHEWEKENSYYNFYSTRLNLF